MHDAFLALYHRHVGAAFDRQMRLADLIEREAPGEPYEYTISKGSLVFGGRVRFTALDLGSYAEPTDSWLWSWCDPSLKLTPDNRRLAEKVRRLASSTGVPAFAAATQFSCTELLGPDVGEAAAHAIAAIAAGELGFDAYYCVPFANGQCVALLRDARLREPAPNPAARIASVFPAVLSSFPVPNHREALVSYIRWHGLPVEEGHDAIRVVVDGEEQLRADFDSRRRLAKLDASIRPSR